MYRLIPLIPLNTSKQNNKTRMKTTSSSLQQEKNTVYNIFNIYINIDYKFVINIHSIYIHEALIIQVFLMKNKKSCIIQ